jgi:secreted trypsin-like serine protease
LREPGKCGTPAIKPDTTSTIIGGKDAIPYSWPWQVVLEVKRANGQFGLTCGGTLISKQWVMSAGHCIDPQAPVANYRIKLGVFDQTKNDETGEVIAEIEEAHVHPKFSRGGILRPPNNDISLIKLKNPVEFTDHISPICLPSASPSDLPEAGTNIELVGWGRTANSNQAPASPTLKQVLLPLADKQTCKKFIGGLGDFTNVIVCFGIPKSGKTACNGDSGGPAIYQDAKNNNQWTQIGITSFGKGTQTQPCSGDYSAYGRVGAFLDFIKQYVTDLPQ